MYGLVNESPMRWDRQLSSPFATMTRRIYPRTVYEVLCWAEELWNHHGLYSQAIRKSVRYFLTEIEITGDGLELDAQKKYTSTVNEELRLLEHAALVGDDYIGFGNSYTSVYQPFERMLICPTCGGRTPIKKLAGKYSFNAGVFSGRCPYPSCGKSTNFIREDIAVDSEHASPIIVRWPPQYIQLNQHPISKRTKFRLDTVKYTELIDGVRTGDPLYLEDTPWEVIEAVVAGLPFDFAEDEIFHMAHPVSALAQPISKGWGMPAFMSEFEDAVLITMLDKYTESIIADHLIPFRVIAPPAGSGGAEGDPMLSINMGDFTKHVQNMLARHRTNPTEWNFLPFPLEYQSLGGDAQNLLPVEVQQHYERRLLASMGIAAEFYEHTASGMSANAGPLLSLKMFERNWQYFTNDLNKWLTWVVNKVGADRSWEGVTAKLVPIGLSEDPSVREIKLQLAAGNEISRTTAYRGLGINLQQERRMVMAEEDDFMNEMDERKKKQEERAANAEALRTPAPGEQMLAAQQPPPGPGGMPAPGGAPAPAPAPGGASPLPPSAVGAGSGTLDDLMLQADQIAQQILTMDPLNRRKNLIQLKNSNIALHAQVKSRIAALEQQAQQQGVQMVRAGQMPTPSS